MAKKRVQHVVDDLPIEPIDSGLTAPKLEATIKGQVPTNPQGIKTMNKEHANLREEELGSIVEYTDDIDDAEAPLPLPEGNYIAEIKAVEAKWSGNNKKYAAVSFYVPIDAYPADYPLEEAPDGLVLIYRKLSLENNKMSRFNLKRFIQNIGAPPVGRTLDLTQWVGLKGKIVVKHDTWEGTTRPTIDRVLAVS